MATANAEALYQALQKRHGTGPASQGQIKVGLDDLRAIDGLAQQVALALRTQGQGAVRLAAPAPQQERLKDQLQDVEIARIRQALAAADGNQSEAARALRMKRSTLLSKIKKHGL